MRDAAIVGIEPHDFEEFTLFEINCKTHAANVRREGDLAASRASAYMMAALSRMRQLPSFDEFVRGKAQEKPSEAELAKLAEEHEALIAEMWSAEE